jgi:arylsulfatase A-like enzyme
MRNETGDRAKAEFIGLVVSAGLMLAAVPTCFQVLWRVRDCAPADIFVGVGLTAIASVPLALLLIALPALAFGKLMGARDRGTWIPAVVGAAAMWSVAVIVVLLAWKNRDLTAIAVGIGGVSAAISVSVMVARSPALLGPWRASVLLLGVGALLVSTACGLTASGIRETTAVVAFVVMVGAGATLLSKGAYVGLRRASVFVAVAGLVVGALSVAKSSGPATTLASAGFARPTALPNVLLVVLDTTRRDHVGAYGREPSPTPRLDEFAARSVVYDRAFSAAPWTIPSHASLFTGLFPVSHGCSNQHHLWLDDGLTTLAEMLSDRGYQTVSMNSNPYIDHCNLLQGFDDTISLSGPYERLAIHDVALAAGFPERWVDKGGAEAIDALHRWFHERRDPTKPFFMFLNLFESHREYVLPHADREILADGPMGGLRGALFGMRFDPIPYEIGGIEDEVRAGFVKSLYEAEVRYQDRRLGEWLDVLAGRVNLENTLIIVTADHGENLGDHGRWEHIHEINDDLIHVPLIIRYPNGEGAGTRLSGICQLVDVVPTTWDVLGWERPVSGWPGHSLRPGTFQPSDEAFAEVAPYYLHFQRIRIQLGFEAGLGRFNRLRRVVRTKDRKYVWSSDGAHELYDIRRDPTETRNIIEEDAAAAEDLHGRLMTWTAAQPRYVPSIERDQASPAVPVDAETIERLRGLGYVGG